MILQSTFTEIKLYYNQAIFKLNRDKVKVNTKILSFK